MNDLRDWADPKTPRDLCTWVKWDEDRGVIKNGKYVGYWVRIVTSSCTVMDPTKRDAVMVTGTATLEVFDRKWKYVTRDEGLVTMTPPIGEQLEPCFKESKAHARLVERACEEAMDNVKKKFGRWISL